MHCGFWFGYLSSFWTLVLSEFPCWVCSLSPNPHHFWLGTWPFWFILFLGVGVSCVPFEFHWILGGDCGRWELSTMAMWCSFQLWWHLSTFSPLDSLLLHVSIWLFVQWMVESIYSKRALLIWYPSFSCWHCEQFGSFCFASLENRWFTCHDD